MARLKGAKAAETCCGEGCCGADSACCGLPVSGCCQIEAVVAVDGRGQMILPKEVRESFGLGSGEKLAVVVWKQQDKPCCITLHKTEELAERLRTAYGPLLKEIVR